MKKGTLKTIAVVLAFLILGTAVTACITKGFKDWNPYGWFDKECEHEYGEDGKCTKCGEEKSDEQDDKDSAEVISESYDVIGHGMKLNVMRSTVALNSDEGIATVAETATSYTVTATVLDVASTKIDILQDVKYDMAWASTNSDSVTNYVTMTVDGMNATFTLIKAFPTQIIVTCTSNYDSSKSATLTLDYLQRIEQNFNFSWDDEGSYDSNRICQVEFADDWTAGGLGHITYNSFKCTGMSFGIGSKENSIKSIAVTFSASEDFLTYCGNQSQPINYLKGQATTGTKTFTSVSAFQFSQWDIYNAIWPEIITDLSTANGYRAGMLSALANTTNQFNLKVVVTPTYGDAITCNVVLSATVSLTVSSVSLSSSGYVF